jgi:hypothetical protein
MDRHYSGFYTAELLESSDACSRVDPRCKSSSARRIRLSELQETAAAWRVLDLFQLPESF